MRNIISKIWCQKIAAHLDSTAKCVAGALAVTALLSLFFPQFEKYVSTFIAWRFGATGYVYYEVGTDNDITADGQLRLLADSRFLFEQIRFGDKLQSASDVNFRDQPTNSARTRFTLAKPDCVVVLSVDKAVPVQVAQSGGWLFVGTTSCGLFN